jgi:outer membrane biogenesis lipoprotein LolB
MQNAQRKTSGVLRLAFGVLRSSRVVQRPVEVILGATLLLTSGACAPRGFVPPSGPSTPLSDYQSVFQEATAACRDIRSLTAEVGLSGQIEGRRVRGRLQLGVAADSMRVEAMAPFGQPMFILAADGDRATLVLPRDRRHVTDSSASPIVEALTGFALSGDDLRAVLAGCVSASTEPRDGVQYGETWRTITLEDGTSLYLREENGRARVVAGMRQGLLVEYPDALATTGEPREIRLSASGSDQPRASLTLRVSQLARNVDLPAEAFRVSIPEGSTPMNVAELKQGGPLGEHGK